MKKIIFISIIFFCISKAGYAQLKVDSVGKITMSELTTSLKDRVIIGDLPTKTFYKYSNLTSTINGNYYTSGYRVAILGDANVSASSSTSNVGVLGMTGSSYGSSSNFGVWGRIGSSKGAAIYGSCDGISAPPIYGTNAGVFSGPVYVYGTLTATSVVTSSDKELKENISPLESGDDRNASALEKIMAMNAVKYNFKSFTAEGSEYNMEDNNISSKEPISKEEPVLHFGLLAQELQEIYPNLVVKGQDGYLGINYIELVPVLIRSIQELKAELDEVKGAGNTMLMAPKQETTAGTSGDSQTLNFKPQTSKLYQNTPNPFTERTEIRFTLPDDAQNAYIYIFDMQGKMLRQIPVDASMQSVTINGYELSAGIYLYSLAVNGQEIDTKRMILSK